MTLITNTQADNEGLEKVDAVSSAHHPRLCVHRYILQLRQRPVYLGSVSFIDDSGCF